MSNKTWRLTTFTWSIPQSATSRSKQILHIICSSFLKMCCTFTDLDGAHIHSIVVHAWCEMNARLLSHWHWDGFVTTLVQKRNFWFAFCFNVPPRHPTEDGGGIGGLQRCAAQTEQKNERDRERKKALQLKEVCWEAWEAHSSYPKQHRHSGPLSETQTPPHHVLHFKANVFPQAPYL